MMEHLLTMTRERPSMKSLIACSFSSADMEPVTSTAPWMACVSAADSSLRSHHTIQGSSGSALTTSAHAFTLSDSDALRALRCSLSPLASIGIRYPAAR